VAIDCAVGSNSRDKSSGARLERNNSAIYRRNYSGQALRSLGIATPHKQSFRVSTKAGQIHTHSLIALVRVRPEQGYLARISVN
jgi:hypothetical protein